MKRFWTSALTAGVVALAIGATGCLISYDPDSAKVDDFVPGDTNPSLLIVDPHPSEAFTTTIPVTVSVRNVTLVTPSGQGNNPGEGHLRVYVAGQCLSDATNPGPGATAHCPTPRALTDTRFDVDISGLAEGTHRLQVELRNNDGSPFTYSTDAGVRELRPVVVDFTKN
jgi:hypothetical protein